MNFLGQKLSFLTLTIAQWRHEGTLRCGLAESRARRRPYGQFPSLISLARLIARTSYLHHSTQRLELYKPWSFVKIVNFPFNARFTLADPMPRLGSDAIGGNSGRNHPTSRRHTIHIGRVACNASVGTRESYNIVRLPGWYGERVLFIITLSCVVHVRLPIGRRRRAILSIRYGMFARAVVHFTDRKPSKHTITYLCMTHNPNPSEQL